MNTSNIPFKIQEAIQNNNLVIFVGSGLSLRFNLPNWGKLVSDIITRIDKEEFNVFLPVLKIGAMKPIEVLDKLHSEHNEIRKYIKDNFGITNGDLKTHQKLLELSGKIITTNYDNSFEKASNDTIIPTIYTSLFNLSEINKNNSNFIFKLHGSYTEPDNCIIFTDDYNSLYSDDSAAKEKLKSIFTEKIILFIGFSFSDPDINLIFENLDKTFGNNNKHFILAKDLKSFENYKFLETILINNYESDIEHYIETLLEFKNTNNVKFEIKEKTELKNSETKKTKIALLSPNPIDIDFKDDFIKAINCFDNLNTDIYTGYLNFKTLSLIDDFDLLIIISKVYRSNIYVEDENLKSNLFHPSEICLNVPNDKIPIIFITNEKIEILNHLYINISTYKNSVINRFIHKALKEQELNFQEEYITIKLEKIINTKIEKGNATFFSIYGNNKNLDIGKKSLNNVIGRIEEQSTIATKLINIQRTNKVLNIKASGGTGKTTLIKKVAYELYNRGYFSNGVSFKSCENVKNYFDFEEILIDGFNLANILNFKEYITANYSNSRLDLLIILDNFETVVNNLDRNEFENVIGLLKFVSDFANIVITSREKISSDDDFEDLYSLTPLLTDDALELFQLHYGKVENSEIKILREEILEELLNNNPLAIKLVTKSRTRYKYIEQLKDQLKENFFESINEDYSNVFNNKADLNIERTRSIYQSINYSYTTLSNKEKIAFELLSLFPDGISLTNFKKCFTKSTSSNQISDKELRILKDKSLIEDYNGILQLQPIIRRFADYQFSKKSKEVKSKYCLDAYLFNCFVLDIIVYIEKKKNRSESLRSYNLFKNNLFNVINYIKDIELDNNKLVPEKKYLLNYIGELYGFIVNEKQIDEFESKLKSIQDYFSDLENADIFLKVLFYNNIYYLQEFDNSYKELSQYLSIEEMEKRNFKNEDIIEKRYKHIISNILSMEGYTMQRIKSFVYNDSTSHYLDSHFYYLGIINNISRKKDGFYYYEYELMYNRLDIQKLEKYIDSLYSEENLEIMQCNYILSKVKTLDKKTIQKLVVTNPYTKGLKELMFASISNDNDEKIKYFEKALNNLIHIKYYYLEAIYQYCLFLKTVNQTEYQKKLKIGLELSKKYYYQYLEFLFNNIESENKPDYNFSYSYYPLEGFEDYVKKHNETWEKEFKMREIAT